MNARNPPAAASHLWELPAKPWQQLHVDYAGPFLDQMSLVASDAFSKFLEIQIVTSATATAATECLMDLFKTYGRVEHLVSDNGTCYTAAEFRSFCARNGVYRSTSDPVRPASNGLAERMVQTFKRGMKKMTEE